RHAGTWIGESNRIVILLDRPRRGRTAEEYEAAEIDAVVDPRIDVFAQSSIRRLRMSTPSDAREMLDAVKDGSLSGIYKEDEQVPALRALKLGKTWWTLIPPGEDAALVLDPSSPMTGAPLIAFRDS